MEELFRELEQQMLCGRETVLATIIASSGSTPRGAGSRMLILSDGSIRGSIGGGAVEYRAARMAVELLGKKESRFESYRLAPGDVANVGMICGGDVRVYFQYFDPADREARTALADALSLLDASGPSWLVTAMDGSGWRMGTCDRSRGLRGPEIPMERLEPLLGGRGMLAEDETALFAEPLVQAGTVYLFGGGHVAQALAHILAITDFRVSVYDQRKQLVSREFFPEAAARLCGPFPEALERIGTITGDDYIVIMTPGHQGDYEVLSQMLRTPAKYIGCICSRKKIAVTRERLLADGFTEADIGRVHAPIGLPIGGETPAEVAVSVAAQLIACRSGRLEAFR